MIRPLCLAATLVLGLSTGPATAEQFRFDWTASTVEEAALLHLGLALYERRHGARDAGARVEQRGRNNRAALSQSGPSQRALIRQDGRGHAAALSQSGARNAQVLLQYGRGTDASVVQEGRGQAGITFLFGY